MVHKDVNSDCGVTVPDVPASFSEDSTFSGELDYMHEAFTLHATEFVADASTLLPPRDVNTHLESPDHVKLRELFS